MIPTLGKFGRKLTPFLTLAALCGIAAPQIATAGYEPGSLVANWKLDEGTGETSADQSGNGNTVQVKITPTWQPAGGQFGGAVEFNGSGDHGTFPASATFASLGDTGTVTMWIYPHNLSRRNQLFEGPDNTGFECQYRTNSGGQFYGSPNRAVGNGSDYVIEAGGSASQVNTWICLQYTWDKTTATSGEMRIYKDGVEISYLGGFDQNVGSWNNAVDGTIGTYYIGRDPGDGSRYFDGLIDDFAIYDAVLSTGDLDTIRTTGAANVTTNQLVHYAFDETTGTTAADSSSNGIDLALSESGPELVTAEAPPRAHLGGSLDFTSTAASAVVSDSATLDWDKNEGTILMWYKPQTVSSRQAIIHGLNGSGTKTFEVQVSGSSGALQYRPFLNLQPSANSHYPLASLSTQSGMGNENIWHHIAWSWDMSRPVGTQAQPNRIRGFHNGVYTDNFGASDPDANWNTAPVTEDWSLGYYGGDGRDLEGNLAEVALFNVGLSDEDVEFIYNFGVEAFVSAPNLTGTDVFDSVTTDNCSPTSHTNDLIVDIFTSGITGTANYVFVSEDSFATSTSIAYANPVQYTLGSATEGDRVIEVRLGEFDGAPASDTVSDTINYDATGPTGSVVTGPSGSGVDVAGVVDVAFTAATDGGANPSGATGVRLWYRKDAGSWTLYNSGNVYSVSPISFDTNTLGGNGTYEVYCVGVDCAGNDETKAQAAEQTFTVTADVREWMEIH